MLIFLLLLICYTILLLKLIFIVLFKKKTIQKNKSLHPVSIVIPFRNEQDNLPILLHSLKDLNYQGKFEVLLINDGSTDDSVKVINQNLLNIERDIIVLNSSFSPQCNLTSKQQAIDLGICHAKFDWIALTDADMKFDPEWLSSLMENTSEKVDLVFGHTSIVGNNSLFNLIQKFQLEFLFATAYAFYHAGINGSCMGNNILISKRAYEKSGGQKAIGFNIAEDRALLNLFRKKKMGITSTDPFTPSAFTFPCKEWKQFLLQIKRWAKGGFDWRSNLLPIGLLLSLQNLFLFFCFTNSFHPLLSITAVVNFLLTWLFAIVTFKKIKASQNPLFFPFYYLFLFLESIVFLFSILTSREIEWKGRKLNNR